MCLCAEEEERELLSFPFVLARWKRGFVLTASVASGGGGLELKRYVGSYTKQVHVDKVDR